jgi:hypothetical protein
MVKLVVISMYLEAIAIFKFVGKFLQEVEYFDNGTVGEWVRWDVLEVVL